MLYGGVVSPAVAEEFRTTSQGAPGIDLCILG